MVTAVCKLKISNPNSGLGFRGIPQPSKLDAIKISLEHPCPCAPLLILPTTLIQKVARNPPY